MPYVSPLIIEYWEINPNCSPVVEFIQGVSPVGAQSKIQSVIQLLGDTGMSLLTNPKLFRKLAGFENLYELRISWGKSAYRILVVVKKSVAYLVHAFKKQRNRELSHLRLGAQRGNIIMNTSFAN